MGILQGVRICTFSAIVMAGIIAFPGIGFSDNILEHTKKNCIPLNEMPLTETQKLSLETIQADFRKDILQIRSSLLAKKIELNDQLRDPSVDETAIWAKAQEVEKFNASLEEAILHYQLRIRRILTAEQIATWCAGMETASTKVWRP